MTFPVPVDARAAKTFQIIRGQEELIRQSGPINDKTVAIAFGEWLKPVMVSGVVTYAKLVTAVDTSAAPAAGAKPSWTKFHPTSMSLGQGDALATGTVDVLSGTYQALTDHFAAGQTYNPGDLLVAIYDATLGGVLFPVAPGSATDTQRACVVGRVVSSVQGGLLHYECPA